MIAVNGLVYPIQTAAFGFVWVIGRVLYAIGYKASPEKRKFGAILTHLGDFPLMLMPLIIAYNMMNKGLMKNWLIE